MYYWDKSNKGGIEMSEYFSKRRLSQNGVYCSECSEFVYICYTNEELEDVKTGYPVCSKCGKNHEMI